MKLIPFLADDIMCEPPMLSPVIEAREHAFSFSRCLAGRLDFQWHYHKEVELVWVRKGTGMRRLGNSVELFHDGDLVLVGPNLPHAWVSDAAQGGDADWSIVQFLPERWGNSFWEMAEVEGLLKLFKKAESGLQFTGKDAREIGKLMENLQDVPPYSFEAFSLFVEICRHLLLAQHRPINVSSMVPATNCADQRFRRALALIDTLSQDRLSQAYLAGELNMSPATFSRWFKQHMGRTFQRYVNEVRVARVCVELAQSGDKITSVAMNSGYHNLANFNRRFREIMGITPKAFRTRARSRKTVQSVRLPAGRARRLQMA